MLFKSSGPVFRLYSSAFAVMLVFVCSCGGSGGGSSLSSEGEPRLAMAGEGGSEPASQVYALMVVPVRPLPGMPFRVVAAGGKDILKGDLTVKGVSGLQEGEHSRKGGVLPSWRVDEFGALPAGKYRAELKAGGAIRAAAEFEVSVAEPVQRNGMIWKTEKGWDAGTELLYSAWISSLFEGCGEDSIWPALHEVTRSRERNFLFNCLSLGEDEQDSRSTVIMQPDCADNPFFLRAYFAWKLGLPFGFHLCDRGYVNHSPRTGDWITNSSGSHQPDPVQAFNIFMRRVADGVHSGTARTALDNDNSDYYPVSLDRSSLRPGTVYADPYGHTLIITGWIAQTRNEPGLLLAVDAQPDGTVGIKRFWKGNFLFNTKDVVGEPGFKAFRPVSYRDGRISLVTNAVLEKDPGFVAPSFVQKKMNSGLFYNTMERLINPEPLDPEAAMLDLIDALHEQLLVRVTSVANGEEWFRTHPGSVIPMPSNARGIFLAGGQWENFSTPNRDLRLLIAIDAVLGFPERVAASPGDFRVPGSASPEEIKQELQKILEKKAAELSISYTRTDGSVQELSIADILARREAFEMAYNPNDGAEIRWGAAENSAERSTCRRQAPASQRATMQAVRKWFTNRLHPPT